MFKNHVLCDTCHKAKQKKLPFVLSDSTTSKFFENLHMDIWGPCSIISVHGFWYFLTIVDDFSRYTWMIHMRTKSEVKTHIASFFYLMLKTIFKPLSKLYVLIMGLNLL